MGRASTEHNEAVEVMSKAVLTNVFTNEELRAMFLEAVKRMTVNEMHNLVNDHTRFEDLLDVDVALM